MKIVVFTDIHGNLKALEAGLEGASYLLIDVSEDSINYKRINLMERTRFIKWFLLSKI